MLDFELIAVGNEVAETWIRRVRWLQRRSPHGGKVRASIVQIGRLPLCKRGVHVLVGVMHYDHKRNAYDYVLESRAKRIRYR